jgi:hypothetical protein
MFRWLLTDAAEHSIALLDITDNLGDDEAPEVDRIILPFICSSDAAR